MKTFTQSRTHHKRGGVMRSAIGLLLFVSAGCTLGWMLLLPTAVKSELEARTGFTMEVSSLSCNPLGLSINARNLVVANPQEFGGGPPMLLIARLKLEGRLPALGRGELWADVLEIEVSNAVIVRDERGRLNLDTFMERLFATPESGKPLPFYAEKTHLIIDEVTFVDYSLAVPKSQSYRVALDLNLREIENFEEIFRPILELGERVVDL